MMSVIVDKCELVFPGSEIWIDSISETGDCAVVFEDDGETAYLYASEQPNGEFKIADALHIYDAESLSEISKKSSSELKLGWSSCGKQAALLINGQTHAVFDFISKNGWCRTNFPPSNKVWSIMGHEWNDDALSFFK